MEALIVDIENELRFISGEYKMPLSCFPAFLIIRKPGIQENLKCLFHAFLHSLLGSQESRNKKT